MKMRQPIDLHKGLTFPLVLTMMLVTGNLSLGPWVYLALHGSYGILWVAKSRIFPDPTWEEEVPLWFGCGTFVALLAYWIAPVILVLGNALPPPWLVWLTVTMNILGVFLHFVSDAQKYYILRMQRGLIRDGFFARTRNPNYLGEILIYSSFAALSMHWLPFVVLAIFFLGIFLPNMRKKDRSMSRYADWNDYVGRTGLLLPRFPEGLREALKRR